ncbi:MAG: hypothetical protein A2268_05190 [Candidatus Raymondbacteria bacterium RifOxyA12_full_50_37]|nr:MAG: hypothetical protein A2268_05190 [Candidatus Raymondbacteria bacterium RifOxyA12_full_50_37]OGJ88962.1 MAG: hypothetical protein A2248_02425 [Candidatus Raymondbacteria bacterium RIFOXYA2_FULL_49_16]OGJ96990.1 MAG: hypothetical protein A2453_03845 [Candidatus Raymondbacteria bacterium RIFOXYC2_FULL_50_21]OGK02535.1 MAG: hypothetical protein A2487_14910 [Candidatus Raymondbacteria bacterium RifOxyC12_full_50_8]OGK02618.1 MAG: hypothetical protein A2350_10245 [Candidatus Raymondbacteria b
MKYGLLFVILAVAAGCGSGGPGDIAGTGSESPNALSGSVYASIALDEIHVVASATISLYAIQVDSLGDYAWELDTIAASGANGKFALAPRHSGYYSIIGCKDGLKFFSGYFYYDKEHASLVPSNALDTLVLQNTMNITGTISDTANMVAQSFAVWLVGTPYFDTISSNDSFHFDSIPSGDYSFEILSTFTIGPRDTTVAGNSPLFVTSVASMTNAVVVIPYSGISVHMMPAAAVTDSVNVAYNGVTGSISITNGSITIDYFIIENH